MATTTVTGTIHGVNNTALANKWISFRLVQLGTDAVATATVAQSVDSVQTDANGDFSVGIWNNGGSGKTSVLEIAIQGSKAEYVIIPTGVATIELWDLIENYQADGSTSEQLPVVSELFVRKSNNLSDLVSKSIARQNLDLEIGVDVQAHSAILDATTASFTTAEKSKLSGIEALAEVNDPTTLLEADIGSTVQAYASVLQNTTASYTTEEETKLSGMPDSIIYVKEASDLAGVLVSDKVYQIDGIVDMGSQSIEVPAGGLSLIGTTFDVCQLVSSAVGYTMFTSPAGGSGNLLGKDLGFTASGAGSQVFDLVSATGFDAFEFSRINFNDCTSLGTVDNYRQGLEEGTGRFGGTPTLTLKGTWVGGYRITTSIVRSLDDFSGALFQRGLSFSMASRFLTDINCDLPASAALMDFFPADFPNPSTLQIQGAIITRNGVSDANDANITPNILPSDLSSAWRDNTGIKGTFVGGQANLTGELLTTINTINVEEDLAGTWTASGLEHFDNPTNGHLRHLGNDPKQYQVTFDMVLEGTATNTYELRLVKFDGTTTTLEFSQKRVINSLQGARNVGYFGGTAYVLMDQNDVVYWKVVNTTSASDCTLEEGSQFNVEAR
jgi:hypothetical protein